jgi:hypothetical protein
MRFNSIMKRSWRLQQCLWPKNLHHYCILSHLINKMRWGTIGRRERNNRFVRRRSEITPRLRKIIYYRKVSGDICEVLYNRHRERRRSRLERGLARKCEREVNRKRSRKIVSWFQKMYFYRCIALSGRAPVARWNNSHVIIHRVGWYCELKREFKH